MLNFEIQRWDVEKSKWVMQSGGSGDLEYIMREWVFWSNRKVTAIEYRLILIVTQEIVMATTENG